ncbi:MAG: GNAT family N-acetyltransferase [Acidimicrobiia bacterium]
MNESSLETTLGELTVVHATVDQSGAVRELRDDLAIWMIERGIEQWRPGDLPLEWVQECVSQGWVYVVLRDDELIGSVTVVWDDPLVWGEQQEPAGYIHMLMVDRQFAGRGIGRAVLGWAERSVQRSGGALARLDCARGNSELRGYYERAGYQLVKYRDFPDVDSALETALYEKPLRG